MGKNKNEIYVGPDPAAYRTREALRQTRRSMRIGKWYTIKIASRINSSIKEYRKFRLVAKYSTYGVFEEACGIRECFSWFEITYDSIIRKQLPSLIGSE